MASESDNILFLGRTNFREDGKKFGIKNADRRYHLYLIGQTGTGKSTLLENLIFQDIQNGKGVAVLDPHGDMVERLAQRVPEKRRADLIYFNVPDPNCPYGFNPLASVPPTRRALTVSEIIEAFKKIWEKTWGPRLEHLFRNVLLLLLEQPQPSFADITKLFYDPGYLRQAVARVTNPEVRDFWLKEFASYLPRYRAEVIAPLQNKVGKFLADPNLHRVLTQSANSFEVRQVMDEGKILLVNLSKGQLGGDNSSLLGALLVSRIGLAALSRADQPEAARKDSYLYIDEFQNFTTLSTATMLSELRKYHLSITMSHQYLDQLEEDVRKAILGNVGNFISFRVGLEDARLLEALFYPVFNKEDLIALPNYSLYLRLMIDGVPQKPFSGETLPPLP